MFLRRAGILGFFLMCAPWLFAVSSGVMTLKQSIATTEAQLDLTQEMLAKTEIQIGQIAKQLPPINQQYQAEQRVVLKLQQQQIAQEAAIRQEEVNLHQNMMIAYLLSRQPSIKLWLNQENPSDLDRYLYDDRLLSQSHLDALKKLKALYDQLQATLQTESAAAAQLAQTKTNLENTQAELTAQQIERQKILKELRHTLRYERVQLQVLLKDKARLTSIISTHHQAPVGNALPNRLPWPVHGRVVQAFHAPLLGGRVLSNGWLIAAPVGTPVQAVAGGRVVFANWLRGFGLMVIIQHGKDDLTLYAHAQSLYVLEGDQVMPGEVVATAGDSGGNTISGIYFEIRRFGVPVNPRIWLK